MAEEIQKKSSSKGGIVSILVVVVVIALGIWYFSSENNTAPTQTNNQNSSEVGTSSNENAAAAPVQFSTLDIKAQGGKFVPDTLTVQKGNPVMINFTAVDGTYDIAFQDAKIGFDVIAKKGETQVFGFDTKDKDTGSYKFSCVRECGSASSSTMVGTLTIQ